MYTREVGINDFFSSCLFRACLCYDILQQYSQVVNDLFFCVLFVIVKGNGMIDQQIIRAKRPAILEIAHRYGARDIRIFGSVARGDQTETSDLDLIVRFDTGRTLFDQGGLLMELQDLLGVKVDIISERGMRPRFREQVMKEAVPL